MPETAGAGFFIDNFVAKAIASSGATASVSGPLSVNEGDSGETAVPYKITLSQPLPITVEVPYSTVDDTATAPEDYTETSGSVTFAPGETVKTVSVPVHGDTDDEVHKRFLFVLEPPVTSGRGPGAASGDHVVLRTASRTTTVLDDDSTIRIDDVTSNEPPWGNEAAGFTVHLDNPSGRPVTVRFSTEDGSATAPEDYTAVTDAEVTLPPGVVSTVVPVTIRSDTEEEDDERFVVHLHDATGGQIESEEADARASGTPTTPTLRTSSW